jgi:hypothetical protein
VEDIVATCIHAAGNPAVRAEVQRVGSFIGSAATARHINGDELPIVYDGNQIGEGRLDATIPIGFSADETTDVGKAPSKSATTTTTTSSPQTTTRLPPRPTLN